MSGKLSGVIACIGAPLRLKWVMARSISSMSSAESCQSHSLRLAISHPLQAEAPVIGPKGMEGEV